MLSSYRASVGSISSLFANFVEMLVCALLSLLQPPDVQRPTPVLRFGWCSVLLESS